MLKETYRKKDEKIKQKFYNPFANDTDYYTVDEKLPLLIKGKIPHWIPNKNKDIFEVRKLLTSEKEEQRDLNRSIGVYKINNEILISKKILEEESKKLNKRINRDISNNLIIEEKIKNKNPRNYISENRYRELCKYSLKNLFNVNLNKFKEKKDYQINLTEVDNNSKLDKSGDFSNKRLNTETNSVRSENVIKLDKVILKRDILKSSNSSINKPLKDIHEFNKLTNTSKNAKKSIDHEKQEEKTKKQHLASDIVKIEKENHTNLKTEINNTNNINSSILLTTLANENSSKVDEFFRNEINKDYRRKFDINTLHELKEEKEEIDRENNNENLEQNKKVKNENQKSTKLASSMACEPPTTSSLRVSVRDYINKTREVVMLRHSVEIKKETALRMEEDYKNQIESVTESIISLKLVKELFEEDFITKFDKYIKYLRVQREKELSELNTLLETKSQLEKETQKLENKKNKSKELLDLFREYRDFLICVRERKVSLPKFFNENKNYKNNVVNTINPHKKKRNKIKLNDNIFINDGYFTDNSSDKEDQEKSKIIEEKEKLQKARSLLLNQLQANSSENNTNSNKNSRNINNTFSSNYNIKNSNHYISQTASNVNTITNSPSRVHSIANSLSPKKTNKEINTQNINNTLNNINNSNSKVNTIKNEKDLNEPNFLDEIDTLLLEVEPKLIEKFNNYISKPIYETPDDLNEDIKKMQQENINLLKKLTSLSSKVNVLNQDLKKMRIDNDNEIAILSVEMEQRENFLKETQEINKYLLEEKNMILTNLNGTFSNSKYTKNLNLKNHSKNLNNTGNLNNFNLQTQKSNFKKSLVKNKFNQAILYSKINEICNLVIEMPINENEQRELTYNLTTINNINNTNMNKNSLNNANSSLGLISGSTNISQGNIKNISQLERNSNVMFMLKVVEKSVDFLLAKHDSYLKDPKKSILLEKFRIDLEKERKITKAIEVRLKDEKRREVLAEAIIERNSRLIVLPKKRFGDRVKNSEKNVDHLFVKNKDKKNMKGF